MVSSYYKKLCSPILGIAPFRLSTVRSSISAICLSSTTPTLQSSLEEMMKAFMQSTDKNLQELKNATMANIRDIQELKGSIARIEGQIGHLVTKLNRIEEEELQSQLMIERHYMSDEDDSENSYHEHAQVTTTLESEEIVDNNEEQVEQIERVEHHEKSHPPQILICPVTWK
jgi:hypothetical protein